MGDLSQYLVLYSTPTSHNEEISGHHWLPSYNIMHVYNVHVHVCTCMFNPRWLPVFHGSLKIFPSLSLCMYMHACTCVHTTGRPSVLCTCMKFNAHSSPPPPPEQLLWYWWQPSYTSHGLTLGTGICDWPHTLLSMKLSRRVSLLQ